MAFVRSALFPQGTQEQYVRLAAALAGAPVPAGRLLFAAGPVDEGWRVVQVWRSREELDAFNRDHFFPALSAIGGSAFPLPPVVTDFETVELVLSPGQGGATATAPGAAAAGRPSRSR